ncbi:MAG TPA: serine hydrolase domain-containing protein [Panacibacter sp.]|nr:serine hydrolase domain-containing protein [Panacibacter sp.]HNP44594.1 serine hydrolase domain-containing protein [Panacibacter sp.]
MKKMSLCLPVILLVCTLSVSANAQVIKTSNARLSSIDYEKLDRIDTLVNEYIGRKWLTGLVTIVVKDGQLVQYKGYGMADVASKKPMENNSLFRIMSQTKAITSIGIMMLYEQGKLLLDEPIADFIPEYANQVVLDKYNAADTTYTTVPAKRKVTFRDLLTHSSGIDYSDIGSEPMKSIYAKAGIPSGLGYFDKDLLTEMKKMGKLPLGFQPGEKFQYGLNSDLLGCLIQVISGKTLDDFFKTYIFQPLGMNDTYFNVPKEKAGRLATVYTEDEAHNVIPWSHTFRNIDPDYPLMDKHYFSGGAGLTSTAYDYAIFMQMLLNGGKYNGKQILSNRTVEMITSNQLDFHFNGTDDFGLGFEIVTDKGAANGPRSKGSFSWGGYYGTSYWADPKENLVCLIMSQQNPNSHGDLFKRIEAIIYSSVK